MGSEKKTLLIVDDEPQVLKSLKRLLGREYQVFTAQNGIDALEKLRDQPVQVLLSDQRMPSMSGTELLARVREEFPNIVRLMITGYADIDSVVDAINQGNVYRYISKPWDPVELELVIRQAMEHYELFAERERLLIELSEADRLKLAFITVASHELNTPLTIILGMLELAGRKTEDPVILDYVQRSYRSAQQLHSLLVDKFKYLHQNDFRLALQREELSCQQMIEDVGQNLEPFLTLRRHRLQISVRPPELTVGASRQHLLDILENLLTNAIKFSADGSTLKVQAERKEDGVLFEVSDPGVGISTEDQPHIFEPLFCTWDTNHHSTGDYGFCKRGMGLGLAIVKKFVEMHDGQVDFDTTPGKGSVFRVYFPGKKIPNDLGK